MWFVTLIEKLPEFALRLGVAVVILAGGVQLGLWLRFIPSTVFDGQVAEVAPLALTIGVALSLVGLVFKLPAAVGQTKAARRTAAKKRSEYDRLVGNLLFLEDEPRLMLLQLFRTPNGRFEALKASDSFRRLYDLDLVQPESGFHGYGRILRGTMMIARPLWAERERITKDLKDALQTKLSDPSLLDDDVRLKALVQAIADEEAESSQRRSAFI